MMGVVMGSSLGPILANIFMMQLEKSVIPCFACWLNNWKRYFDDTISFIKANSIEYDISKLNNFHKNILAYR